MKLLDVDGNNKFIKKAALYKKDKLWEFYQICNTIQKLKVVKTRFNKF